MKKTITFAKIAALVLAALMLFGACSANRNKNNGSKNDPTDDPNAEPVYDPVEGYGLHIEKNGTVTLNGEIFYGYGTNWHGGFTMALGGSTENRLSRFFEVLHEGKIPYIRVMMGVFYPNEVPQYVERSERYFERMDRFVKLAEKYQIGIIASLMWNKGAFYEYCGEDLTKLGDPNAEGTKLAIKYAQEVVTRYKDSPAIWAWEVGNEGNLGVDLWPEHGPLHSSQMLCNYYDLIGNAIHQIDSYRMISGGDGCPRPNSHSLRNGHGWEYADDLEMTVDSLKYYNPGYLRAASMHVYEYGDADRFEMLLNACKELKLACYVGEFGAGNYTANNIRDALTPEESPEEAEEQKCWNYVVDTLLKNDIQLATQWCFGRLALQTDATSIEVGMTANAYQNVYQWERLIQINNKFIEEGKNKSAEYWASATNLLYKGEE